MPFMDKGSVGLRRRIPQNVTNVAVVTAFAALIAPFPLK
jgi:hypothetical protein